MTNILIILNISLTITILYIPFTTAFTNKDIKSLNEIEYEYCNIQDSLVISHIIKDINIYFNDKLTNKLKSFNLNSKAKSTCLINNDLFLKKMDLYNSISNDNISNYSVYNCNICNKRFKKIEYLFLHASVFHEKDFNKGETYLCPGNFCRFFNCERYMSYYGISATKVKQKKNTCNEKLELFYKQGCMNMVYGCFKNEDGKDDIESYNRFYNLFCNKLSCKDKTEIKSAGSAWTIIKLLLTYISVFVICIYLMIVWILNNNK